jgi:hypothetical protein
VQDIPAVKKSKLREEIEALLERKAIIQENRVSVTNLEGGETNYFDNYHDALKFLKGRKGRWYITSPGLRYSSRER